jgi:hypothetical protein
MKISQFLLISKHLLILFLFYKIFNFKIFFLNNLKNSWG